MGEKTRNLGPIEKSSKKTGGVKKGERKKRGRVPNDLHQEKRGKMSAPSYR